MNIDLDKMMAENAADLPKWDLTIKVRGKDYRVRPINNDDLLKLSKIDSSAIDDYSKLLAGLFEGESPTINELVECSAVLSVIVGYFKEHFSKNSKAISQSVMQRMKRAS